MNKIDWKRKLTSRKLWIAVASLATNIILACGGTESTAVQVTAIIMGGAAVLGYLLAEGLTDAASAKTEPKEDQDPGSSWPADNYGGEGNE